MEISSVLDERAVLAELKAQSKKQALQKISAFMAPICGLAEQEIFNTLNEREKLGSTGTGNGIAIPHGRFSKLSRVYGGFARLPSAIDFDAVDDRPVDLIFVLLAPVAADAEHLKALATVSRLLRNQDICTKLRATSNAEALYSLLTAGAEEAFRRMGA